MSDRQVIIMLSTLRSHMRGVAMSALRRASGFAKQNIPVSIVTFDYCTDYPVIVRNLKAAGYFENYNFVNLFEHFETRKWPAGIARQRSRISALIAHADAPESGGPAIRVVSFKLKDGRRIHRYFRKNGTVYLQAVTLGETYLWEPVLLVEIMDDSGDVVHVLHSERNLWRFFLSDLCEKRNVHIFQDCGYKDRGDVRDKFICVLHGDGIYNYRVAHGATNKIGYDGEPAIPGWKDDNGRLDELDGIIFLTESQKSVWEKSTKIRSNCSVIPHEHGVQVSEYSPREGNRIVTISSLTSLKRVDHIIRAFSMVSPKFPDATLEIYGEGEAKESLQLLAAELSLTEKIIFKGYNIDARDALKGAAVSVVTSTREAFGIPIVESFAYSCPVVAYNVAYGPKSLVKHAKNGILVPNANVEALSNALASVLNDTTTQMREYAFESSKEYLPTSIHSTWIKLIENVESRRAR